MRSARSFAGVVLAWALAFSAAWAAGPVVLDVSIESDDGLPVDALRDALGWTAGAPLDEDTIRAGLGRLRQMPFLVPPSRDDVRLTEAAGGVHVSVRLTRREVVHDISFHGLFPIFDREARNSLRMRIGDPFELAELDHDIRRLERLAERKGFLGTTCQAESEPKEHHSVDLVYRCDRTPWLTVRNVSVEGNTAIPDDEIEHLVRPWFFFDQETFDERLLRVRQRYRERGYVRARATAASVDADPRTENVDLAVRVEEGKRLDVHFDGNRELDATDLDDELPFRREGGSGVFLVDEGADAVRKAYQRAGYPDARVTSERRELADRVEVTYHVSEGEPRSVGHVRFVGNHSIPGHELRKLVQSRKRRWLVLAPHLQDDVLEGDRGALEDYYRARGFVGVEVDTAQRQVVGDRIELLFPIDEGPVARISDIQLDGVPDAVAKAVPKGVPPVLGEPYVAEKIESWREELERAFQLDGHLRGAVGIQEQWSAAADSVALQVYGSPGPHFQVGSVFTVGGENVRGELLERSTYLKRGRDLTPEAIVRTHEDLRELDVFESIRIRPLGLGSARIPGTALARPDGAGTAASASSAREGAERDGTGDRTHHERGRAKDERKAEAEAQDEANDEAKAESKKDAAAETAVEIAPGERTVPVVIELRERPSIRFDVGPSYDTDRGAAGHFTLEVINLLGRAIELKTDGTYGQDDRQASVTFTDPRFLAQHLRGSVSASYKDQNFPAFDRREFETGADLKRELAPKLVGTVGLGYRISDISNVTSFDPEAPVEGITRELIWSAGVVRDTRDDLIFPTRGDYLAGAVGIAAKPLLSDDNFVRLDFQGRHYEKLAERLVAVLSARFTDVELYGSTDRVPTPELLFAGGASSVRGFHEDRLGPVDENGRPLGGGARLLASVELRFPLVWILEGAVFSDAGSVTPDTGSLFREIQPTAGTGFRARTPVGPVRLDVGYQLTPNPPLDRWALHFSFGYPF